MLQPKYLMGVYDKFVQSVYDERPPEALSPGNGRIWSLCRYLTLSATILPTRASKWRSANDPGTGLIGGWSSSTSKRLRAMCHSTTCRTVLVRLSRLFTPG